MNANEEALSYLKPLPFTCLITINKIMDAISGRKVKEREIPCQGFESVEKALSISTNLP